MTRANNIVRYVQEWHGGVWRLGQVPAARENISTRVAENAIAYAGIAETPANLKAYAAAYEALIENGGLALDQTTGGWLYLETKEQQGEPRAASSEEWAGDDEN